MTAPLASVRIDASRFDDSALEHLANKGLVRRAKKLVDSDISVEGTDDGCAVVGEGWQVDFIADAPLQDARCGCSTAGVCQHLVASIMVLRSDSEVPEGVDSPPDSGEPSATATEPPDIRAALSAITDDDFLKWVKTADSRWAASRAEALALEEIVVDGGSYLAVSLPTPHPSVQFMGESLDQAIVKPSGRHDRRSIALAVLALWKLEDRTFTPPATKTIAPINELVEERTSVLARAQRLTEDFLAMGLLHLADPEAERIGSLSASLRGVKLYRLAALAERSADQIDALADLSVTADTGRLLDQLAELSVVAEAISDRMANGIAVAEGLVGTARASYEDIGHLELVGLGGYGWSNARFAGTTTVVAEASGRTFSVHTTSRANGRNIPNASRWTGVGSIGAVSGQLFTLANAHASSSARLSSTDKSTATVSRPLTTSDIEALAWDGSPPSTGSRLLGSTGSSWAVCRVDDVRAPALFDGVEQELVWGITSAETELEVRLPFRGESPAVDNLERLADTSPSGILKRAPKPVEYVIGRLRGTSATGFELWPISVIVDDELINLDDAGGENRRSVGARSTEVVQPVAPVDQIERLGVELTRLAEGGSRAANAESLDRLNRTAEQAGLTVIKTLIDQSPSSQVALLRSSWVLQLAQETD